MIYEKPRIITLAADSESAAGACVNGISNPINDATGCMVGVHAPTSPCATGNVPDTTTYPCSTGDNPGGGTLSCLPGATAGGGAGSCSFGGGATGGGAGSCAIGFSAA